PGEDLRRVGGARPCHGAQQSGHGGRLRARAGPWRGARGARGSASRRPAEQHADARAGHGGDDRARALLPVAGPGSADRGPGRDARGRRLRQPHARPLPARDRAARVKSRRYEIVNPPAAERAVLVGHPARDHRARAGSLEELALLADTAGARVLGTLTQRRSRVHPATFIGKGKVEELKALAAERDADLVIFDDDLSPAQVRNLEKALDRKVIDRSELILDIFSRRART